jgi:hypothetical protein
LEYLDGTNANTDTGMWLHHMVMMNIGPGRMDPTCVGKVSLPHRVLNTDPSKGERVFSSGNERTRVMFNPPWSTGNQLGYFLEKTDKFAFIVDLMNQNMDDKTVYMTITYDVIEGRPTGIDNIKAIWLDVAQCGTSEVIPPQQKGQFKIESTWTANLEGEVLGLGAHLHDGGAYATIAVDGTVICNSTATYGTDGKPMGGGGGAAPASGLTGGVSGGPGMAMADSGGHASPSAKHISAMSGCQGDKLAVKQLKKGQKWVLTGYYDYDKNDGMKHDNGKQENIMAISIMFVKNPKF